MSGGKITLWCTDPEGSCLRQRCECDRDLAEKLAEHENQWNMQNHHKWGSPPFIPQERCAKSGSGVNPWAEALNPAGLDAMMQNGGGEKFAGSDAMVAAVGNRPGGGNGGGNGGKIKVRGVF